MKYYLHLILVFLISQPLIAQQPILISFDLNVNSTDYRAGADPNNGYQARMGLELGIRLAKRNRLLTFDSEKMTNELSLSVGMTQTSIGTFDYEDRYTATHGTIRAGFDLVWPRLVIGTSLHANYLLFRQLGKGDRIGVFENPHPNDFFAGLDAHVGWRFSSRFSIHARHTIVNSNVVSRDQYRMWTYQTTWRYQPRISSIGIRYQLSSAY